MATQSETEHSPILLTREGRDLVDLLQNWKDRKQNLVDLRELEQYKAGHLLDSVCLPFDSLLNRGLLLEYVFYYRIPI